LGRKRKTTILSEGTPYEASKKGEKKKGIAGGSTDHRK